jgi:urea carboxylase
MFSKVLIANRGAIACRIIRTLKKMHIQSVAVYAEADADSAHVRQADEAYCLGGGSAAQTYLDQDKLFAIIARSGAEAVHPGYGFLSENAAFVSRCAAQGVCFIGPSADSIQLFGLKHRARQLAEQFAVPVIPGSGLLTDKAAAIAAAAAITYPVMLKSTAGGGGIGMQVCHDQQQLQQGFDSVVRLSENNFSDGGVFLEKYIARARHLEVQLFGDGAGLVVALGERDCSLQRRNQKVIEETPAPGISDRQRRELHATARRLLQGVSYASAGTVEFIYDTASGKFYFLEVNTRLQVEHGITEERYGVDLVQWMVEQADAPLNDLQQRRDQLQPAGHAIEARIYAEDCARNFQPSAGLLHHVEWPAALQAPCGLRIDSWISAGVEVSSYYDPMLAKVIVHAPDRGSAIAAMQGSLQQCQIRGIETNLSYCEQLMTQAAFVQGDVYTGLLQQWVFASDSVEVLVAGTMTTLQDQRGRRGYWHVGVPPSGAFDNYSFRLGNQLLQNDDDCAGLEITLNGPRLKFNQTQQLTVVGAELPVLLDGQPQLMWSVINVAAGQTLELGSVEGHGARAYLLVRGGFQCPQYLGSKATFTLGQFGGHAGRALRTGDVLHCSAMAALVSGSVDPRRRPVLGKQWTLHAVYGPHGAPDFLTEADVEMFFSADWEVHYNSSRTGIRLLGPKPEWARDSGGEAGMHPSNIHDNAYAFGSVDFTGDMPVILGPDGPSLGGFVCPATVINADLWKLGQLKAGDTLRFIPVAIEAAVALDRALQNGQPLYDLEPVFYHSCVLRRLQLDSGMKVAVRAAGDCFLLVEFGEQKLDLALRFQVAALQQYLEELAANDAGLSSALIDLTPGIRSLQLHYDPHQVPLAQLMAHIEAGCLGLESQQDVTVASRTVYLPLSWDDGVCRQAIDKYMKSVRADAPWCPDNIEFIRRINGLDNVEAVRDIVFDADYVVMGLGDVYLGAPVATPLDPRHRLVTTKYNPARTWTAENSVGIGGAYLCVYGMEGPGGYQFVGRTLQMWNRYQQTTEFELPWLLRNFDRIRFFPVSQQELEQIRRDFPRGDYPLRIEPGEFSLRQYRQYLQQHQAGIDEFQRHRDAAFALELQRWRDSGQLHFDTELAPQNEDVIEALPSGVIAIESTAAGNVWQLLVEEGQAVQQGQPLLVLESMKMEIEVASRCNGAVRRILKAQGTQVRAGQVLLHIEVDE